VYSVRMAENSSVPSAWEIEYMATVYNESLDTLSSYMEVLREYIGLLYGSQVVDRLRSLNLHQDDCRLAGMLIQLAGDERVSSLDG
jgi:hypothetical protein